MRFSIAALTALAAGAVAVNVTTEVVTHYETYCPEATTLIHGTETYPVTAPTTLTLTNGPYTIVKPVSYSVVTSCNSCSTPTPAPPVSTPVSTPAYSNSTIASTYSKIAPSSVKPVSTSPVAPVVPPVAPPSSAIATPPPSGTEAVSPIFTGGAAHAAAGAGAGLATLFGLVALLL